MERQRRSQRHRSYKEGQVLLSDATLIGCLVRDISDSGARLEFGGPTALPKSFRLLLKQSQQIVPVDVAWQRGQSAGVVFTGALGDRSARKG